MEKAESATSSGNSTGRSRKRKKDEEEIIQSLKHYDVFYGQAPPGLIQEEREKPEDCIPDRPENKDAREFLAKAPTKGLWMPLGKEVKVMKCWRCKAYGHRTGDRECPLFLSGNAQSEKFRYKFGLCLQIHEDPMHNFISEQTKADKEERVRQLQALLNSPTSSSDSDSESSSSSSSDNSRKRHKKHKKSKKHCRKSHSHKKKKKKHRN